MTPIFADFDHNLNWFCTKSGQFMDNFSDSLGPPCSLQYKMGKETSAFRLAILVVKNFAILGI